MFKSITTLVTIVFLFNSCTKTTSDPSIPIVPDTRVIALSGNLSFSKLTLQATDTKNFSISNNGNATLKVTGITLPTGFTADWVSGSIAPSKSQNIAVTFKPTQAITYSGEVTVSSDKTSGNNTLIITGTGIDTIFTDARDGEIYKIKFLSDKIWMTESLRYDVPTAGDDVPYNNDATLLKKYGRYYTWNVLMAGGTYTNNNPSGVKGICPLGWHIPSRAEWETLFNFYGKDSGLAYKGLIQGGTSGINLTLAGQWDVVVRQWFNIDLRGWYWSTTQNITASHSYVAALNELTKDNFTIELEDLTKRLPCRCVRD